MLKEAKRAVFTTIAFSLVFLLAVQNSVLAQEEREKIIVIGKVITLKSEILDEERSLFIYLPEGYNQGKRAYPVLYLLDGRGNFHHTTGLVQYFPAKGLGEYMIVVGIQNTDRTRDFTPTRILSRPSSGGADNFIRFFKEELIPFVEKQYRTQPYRILVGHSLGGLFVLYTFLAAPDVFNAYIAISPWTIYDNEYVVRKAEEILENGTSLNKFLFIAAGNEPNLSPSIEKFFSVVESKKLSGLEAYYKNLETENHLTIPHRGLYSGLEALFSDWRMTKEVVEKGVEGIKKHYENLSRKFGYTIKPEFADLYMLGMSLLQQRRMDEAIEILKLNVENNPDNWLAYSSLGSAYRLSNNTELAIRNYEKALQLNPDFTAGREILRKLKEKK
ncbi:MAG: alpha/beta hydrolase-fold protein [Candidatus Aminicenantales bacterium]